MSNPTIAIPAERVPELQKRLDALNKKASKLNCPPISLEVGASFEKQISETQWADYVPVTVVGEAPQLNGWQLIATLEHDENGTLIRRMPLAHEVDLTQYRKATPDNCDHCGYKRRRNDTYIVARNARQEERPFDLTGGWETKQVGSSCLKDFTGHENPEQVARFMTQVRDYIEEVRGGMYEGGHITPRHDLEAVLEIAASDVRQHGYITRKQAHEDASLTATAEAVRTLWHAYVQSGFRDVASEDTERAAKAIAWVRGLSEDDLANEYLYNLFTVCKGDSITERQFGIAASAITAHQQANRHQDGDRCKGQVKRTQEPPTEAQETYIAKLADQLKREEEIPATRLEASDLINQLKEEIADQGASSEPKATDRQLKFINDLMDHRVIPANMRQAARVKIDAGLTKTQASQCIKWLQGFEEAS